MFEFLRREPVIVVNSVITILEASLALGIAFGLTLSPEQKGAIIALVVAIGNLAAMLIARSQVTPSADPRDNQGNPLKADVSQPMRATTSPVIAS